MTTIEQIETVARYVAARTITTATAAAAMRKAGHSARFEMLPNGRCYWYLYGAGLQGSQAAK